jgi:hypothetical protein
MPKSSCIDDKHHSVQENTKQFDMLWKCFVDLNRNAKKRQLAWTFFNRGINAKNNGEIHWYYTLCFSEQPSFSKNCKGVYEYNSQNVTSTIQNHCRCMHSFIFTSFQKYSEDRKEELLD